MADLIEFLRARLDEKATDATQQAKDLSRWLSEDETNGHGTCACQACILVSATLCSEDGQPLPPLHPERALAEVAAERRIVDCLDRSPVPGEDDEHAQGGESALVWVCRVLAAKWGDHPDYDFAWRLD